MLHLLKGDEKLEVENGRDQYNRYVTIFVYGPSSDRAHESMLYKLKATEKNLELAKAIVAAFKLSELKAHYDVGVTWDRGYGYDEVL